MRHQTREDPRFAEEASGANRVFRRGAEQKDFQRNKAIDAKILGAINDTGCTTADLRKNLQSREFNPWLVQGYTPRHEGTARADR
jgi:hypothetical protein